MSLQASSYREVGKVTDNGLIKGHAYAIIDSDKASITQRRHCRLCSTELLSLFTAVLSSYVIFMCLLLFFLFFFCIVCVLSVSAMINLCYMLFKLFHVISPHVILSSSNLIQCDIISLKFDLISLYLMSSNLITSSVIMSFLHQVSFISYHCNLI